MQKLNFLFSQKQQGSRALLQQFAAKILQMRYCLRLVIVCSLQRQKRVRNPQNLKQPGRVVSVGPLSLTRSGPVFI
ncbi:hypothetical protein BC343_04975 [Mucilaginibacter pedocola]|uniref:Uncharacterized protein n=1 Tax=Mucilaginibacter pedocola TaxID=1792845 RepID=A0A1S9PF02_9SPHI|nr:hypothetical protein BC343_04975 [Mucilaginibacter pedocola]